jgi:hypothetical protein
LDVKRKRTFSYENSLHAQLARECGNINAQEESHDERFKIQGNSLKFLSKAAFVYTVCEQNRQTVFLLRNDNFIFIVTVTIYRSYSVDRYKKNPFTFVTFVAIFLSKAAFGYSL